MNQRLTNVFEQSESDGLETEPESFELCTSAPKTATANETCKLRNRYRL